MYSPELEALIKSVIADDKITAVEMRVLRNKAKSLGVDPDEVQVYVEGLILQAGKVPPPMPRMQPRQEPPRIQNAGYVAKCPSCGAILDKVTYVK